MHRKIGLVFLLNFFVAACGTFNQHADDPKGADQPAFVNHSPATIEQLQQQWKLAQQQLATVGFALSIYDPSNVHPPDARALTIEPHGVTVISEPDVPVSQLIALDPRWATHHDPSGTIICDGRTAHSCTDVNANTIYVAASLFPGACQYEFEIIILNALGYDVREM